MIIERDMFIIEVVVLTHLNLAIFVQGRFVILDRLSKISVDDFFGKKSQIKHF